MQEYKSHKNTEIDRKFARQMEKQRGEMPFELNPNSSGGIVTVFPKEYKTIPFITLTPMTDKEHAFEIQCALTQLTPKQFSVDIQNLSGDTIKGTILWHAK